MICGVTQEEYPKHVVYGTTLDFATSVAINAPRMSLAADQIHCMDNLLPLQETAYMCPTGWQDIYKKLDALM